MNTSFFLLILCAPIVQAQIQLSALVCHRPKLRVTHFEKDFHARKYEDWKNFKIHQSRRDPYKYPASSYPPKVCGNYGGYPRVVHGDVAGPLAFPWHVELIVPMESKTLKCGGTLISEQWVITAAHCLGNSTPTVYIGRVPAQEEKDDKFLTTRTVSKAFPHEEYDLSKLIKDIALLKLNQPVPSSGFIQMACLPERPVDLTSPDMICYLHGYGLTDPKGKEGSRTLQYMKVDVMSTKECSENIKNGILRGRLNDPGVPPLNKGYICLSTLHIPGAGACSGDSGSALSCADSQSGVFSIYGLLSFGDCKNKVKLAPDVYTNVWSYLPWIKRTVIREMGKLPEGWR